MCDLVVVGPSPLELCFGDLPRVPRPGEELLCRQLDIRPRSAALTALAAGRLGLRTALWSPFADDFPGRYLKGLLADGGVRWLGPVASRSAVLVDFGRECGTGITVEADGVPARPALDEAPPRAVAAGLDALGSVPSGACGYAIAGGDGTLADLERAPVRALLAAAPAAVRLAGGDPADDPEAVIDAAHRLAAACELVVVDRGAEGALAVGAGEATEITGAPAGRHPAHLAHSLFLAAYLWGDLHGLPLSERLRWATLHAARGDLP